MFIPQTPSRRGSLQRSVFETYLGLIYIHAVFMDMSDAAMHHLFPRPTLCTLYLTWYRGNCSALRPSMQGAAYAWSGTAGRFFSSWIADPCLIEYRGPSFQEHTNRKHQLYDGSIVSRHPLVHTPPMHSPCSALTTLASIYNKLTSQCNAGRPNWMKQCSSCGDST